MSADSGGAAHPALDELAAAELADADPDLTGHLANCPDCRRRLAAVERMRADLAHLPPEPMPEVTAARVHRRLREQLAAAGPPPPRRWRRPGPALAAAAAAVLLISGTIVGALRSGGGSGGESAGESAAAAAPLGSYRQVTSAVDYTPSTLAAELPDLLHGAHVAAGNAAAAAAPLAEVPAPAPTSGRGANAGAYQSSVPMPPTPADAALARLSTRAALTRCLAALLPDQRAVRTPLLEAFARYEGTPAAIIVQSDPAQPSDVQVWVVGAACGQPGAGPNLLHFAVLPRP